MGDWNDRAESKVNDSVIGCYGEYVVNDNRKRLIHLCEQQVLKISDVRVPKCGSDHFLLLEKTLLRRKQNSPTHRPAEHLGTH